jgi:hypothetical protein
MAGVRIAMVVADRATTEKEDKEEQAEGGGDEFGGRFHDKRLKD